LTSYRKQRLTKAILTAEPNTPLIEIGRRAGISPKSGNVYRSNIKQQIAEIMSKGDITIKDVEAMHLDLVELALSKGDITNASRNTESLGRMKMAYTDKQVTEGSINQVVIIDKTTPIQATNIDECKPLSDNRLAVDHSKVEG
jgi:hypothetical protein